MRSAYLLHFLPQLLLAAVFVVALLVGGLKAATSLWTLAAALAALAAAVLVVARAPKTVVPVTRPAAGKVLKHLAGALVVVYVLAVVRTAVMTYALEQAAGDSAEARQRVAIVPDSEIELGRRNRDDGVARSIGYASFRIPADSTIEGLGGRGSVLIENGAVKIFLSAPRTMPAAEENVRQLELALRPPLVRLHAWLSGEDASQPRQRRSFVDLERMCAGVTPPSAWQRFVLALDPTRAFASSMELQFKRTLFPSSLNRIVPFHTDRLVGLIFITHDGAQGQIQFTTKDRSVDGELAYWLHTPETEPPGDDVRALLSSYETLVDHPPSVDEAAAMVAAAGIPLRPAKDSSTGNKESGAASP